MFGTVPLTPKSIDDYRAMVGDEPIDQIRRLADPLVGARILNLSVTTVGTGVAETLVTAVPLMNSLGIHCQWQVVRRTDEFTAVYRAMYRALGGSPYPWSEDMDQVWLRYNAMNADLYEDEYDFVVIHDPQPAGILSAVVERQGHRPRGRWIWHCHIDLSEAQEEVWRLLRPRLGEYDRFVFDLPEYQRSDLPAVGTATIAPAIDPLGPRNMELPQHTLKTLLQSCHIDPDAPIICQVSPFDQAHDLAGLIDVYDRLKPSVPGLQLVLVAMTSAEEPEHVAYYETIARRAHADPNIFIFSDIEALGNVQLNMLQRAARVITQRSIRKGVPLWLLEALWKRKPIVAGRDSWLEREIVDGETGFLVPTDAIDVWAQRVLYLLEHPETAAAMGNAGHHRVRERYLITRYLHDQLLMLRGLS